MIKEAIMKLSNGNNLSYDEAEKVIDEIMSGETSQAQTAAFLSSLHIKGETVDEITASAYAMRSHCPKVQHNAEVIDIVGTGGDCAKTINISTAAAIVAAAAGIHVAKHGNRAASSKCGTADCLEALGVNLQLSAEKSEQLLNELGITFLFAQKYHTAMKYVGPVRKDIGIPTVFNILGPLANPARAEYQLMGVYKEELVEPIAKVLSKLGVKKGMVVYGMDCLDEISLSDKTKVCEINNGEFKTYYIDPENYSMKLCKKEELVGGNPHENAQYIREILHGKKGPMRDVVVLNAGAAIHIVKDVTIEDGIKIAEEMIDSGKAEEVLNKLIKMSNEI